jgi:two-component system, NarL family, response regulator DesR
VIRVVILEDMPLLRSALVALLSLEPDIEVAAAVGCGDELIAAAADRPPDVAVIDIDVPGMDGLTVASVLHQRLPGCRSLILAGLSRPGELRRALEAHASGFLLKETSVSRLADTIRCIARGERVIDSEAAAEAIRAEGSPMTARELVVLRCAAEGATVGEIAARLFLSAGTVRNYLSAVIRKSGARNRIDAIRIAREAGWI